MEYVRETLDRATGQLQTQSSGDWITVTELGQLHGVGKRKVRAILHHMGVLAREGRCYRLPHHLVATGIGMRHDFTRSGHAFDVISPKGKEAIASMWSATVQDYEAGRQVNTVVGAIRTALECFKAQRHQPMKAQEEVCWVLDHFREVDHLTVANALEVSPALASRYATKRTKQRAAHERKKQETLPDVVGPIDRLRQLASVGSMLVDA